MAELSVGVSLITVRSSCSLGCLNIDSRSTAVSAFRRPSDQDKWSTQAALSVVVSLVIARARAR